ncbi:GntR family transcriptional regulator [Mangrovicoccus algicola]|uniref:GntR family transcriptional regulator n=1 Tax=Mangrovicoccus algicola TaxID=2771008 RepID=A0A8J6YTB7_9RHOB|nr:GntR family transcriptional regulator [Mangrovicoccus algicola]MBE3638823.1 GntR family transcriptional regulator [Mangrovicoccus algicola]
MNRASKAETALDSIRRDICIHASDGETVLHETELSRRFGMSRTPIRQILQRLAYERLVQTRSGVGTVVTPLLEQDRLRDLRSYKGIIDAILRHDLPALSVSQHADILALEGFARSMQPDDPELQYELLTRLHAGLAQLVEDPVLADAFSASFWRAVRWYMRDLAADPGRATERLKGQIADITGYADRRAADLFARVRDNTRG